ncbi:MAG TPA: TolC family protein [Vicingaceae bacterium]
MKRKKIVAFTLIGLLASTTLVAQSTQKISLQEIEAKVIENNHQLKITQQQFIEARAEYRQTNSVLLPNLSISYTGFKTNNPVYAFGAKLNQGNFTMQDFDINNLNNPDAIENYTTTFQVEQPLINVDGMYYRQAAKSKMDAIELQNAFKQDALLIEVQKAYMQLQVANEAVKVLEKANTTAQETKKVVTSFYEQQIIQESDLLLVEIRVNEIENQLAQAKSAVKNTSDFIHYLMGTGSDNIIEPADELEATVVLASTNTSVDALKNRSDIKAMELSTNAYKKMSNASKMAFVPRLNAFGNYELFDDQVFGTNANSYFVGAQLKWDLFQGGKNVGKWQKNAAQYQQSKLEYEQYLAKSQVEINQMNRSLIDAQNQMELAKKSMEQAEEVLRIKTNRFNQGLEKTSDLLMAETQFSEKQLAYYQSIFQYNLMQAYLKFLTK